MTAPTVSVIIVSRGRPDILRRCLTGVSQLAYPSFEVIVVADPQGVAAVTKMGWSGRAKLISFDEANISAARNTGIDQAGGEIVAFIDDDAVPEPTWLTNLCAPFENPDVAASGGFVIGRNGISYQWRARIALENAETEPLDVDLPTILPGAAGCAIKTEGTNMAVRRRVLHDLGGFDPAFAFYLDETDLNMRLATTGALTAIVPQALVHHGFAASARRTRSRVPTDLHQIGASTAVFLRKHAPQTDLVVAQHGTRNTQRNRLLRHVVSGGLEPGDVDRILATFDAGWREGLTRTTGEPTAFKATRNFQPVIPLPALPHQNIGGRIWQATRLRAQARHAVAQGHRVSVYLFDASIRYHRIQFHPDGYWEQTGGQFGKSSRDDKPVSFWSSAARLRREIERVVTFRQPK